MYIYFNVNIVDKDTHDLVRTIVSQLVEPSCVDSVRAEFVKYAKTKGYTIMEGLNECDDNILLYSNNNRYAMIISTYMKLSVKNDTVIDVITRDFLSEEYYDGNTQNPQIYF